LEESFTVFGTMTDPKLGAISSETPAFSNHADWWSVPIFSMRRWPPVPF